MFRSKIFVSGKYDDKFFIGEKILELEVLGCHTTYNWTSDNHQTDLKLIIQIKSVD